MASGSGSGSGADNNNSHQQQQREIQSDPSSTENENEISISTISNTNSSRDRGGQQITEYGSGPGQGQGQGQGHQAPMDYNRFFHSLSMMNMNAQAQARLSGGNGNNHNNPFSHPLLPPMLHPDHTNPRWGFLNVSNRSFWTKYCLLCTVCGSAATILAGIFLVIAALFRYYTTSIYYFETVPTYIPAILLSICGVSTIAFSCKRNRNIILLRITACWSLVSAALASVITITTSLIHMNRLQTLRECVYNGKPSPPSCTCLAHTLSFDNFGNNFEPVHYVFENTPDCDVIHGTLYSCLRAVFAISVVAVLLSIFLCMLLYQLIGHERKKAYWSRVRRTNSDWSADFMACLPRPMARDRSSMMPLVMPSSSMSMSMPLSPTSMSMSMSGGPGGGGCSGNGPPFLPFHPGLFAWGPPPPYEDLSAQGQDHRSRQLPTTSTTTVTVNLSPTSRHHQQQQQQQPGTSSGGRQRQPPTKFIALPPAPLTSSIIGDSDTNSNQNHNHNHGSSSFNFDRRTTDESRQYPGINVNAFSPTITSMDFTSSRLLQQRSNPVLINNPNGSGGGYNPNNNNNNDNDNEQSQSPVDLDQVERFTMAMVMSMSMTVTPPDSFRDTETETEPETDCEIQQIRKKESKPSEIVDRKYYYGNRCPGDFPYEDEDEAEIEAEAEAEKLLQKSRQDKIAAKTKKSISVVATIHQTDKEAVDVDGGIDKCGRSGSKEKDSIESLLLSESYPGFGSGYRNGHVGCDVDSGSEVAPLGNSGSVSASAGTNSNGNANLTKNRIVRSFRLEKITSLPNSPILMNVRKFCSFRLGDKDKNERKFRSVAKLNEDRDLLDSILISSSISNSNVHSQPHPSSEHDVLMMMEPKNKKLCALPSSQNQSR